VSPTLVAILHPSFSFRNSDSFMVNFITNCDSQASNKKKWLERDPWN